MERKYLARYIHRVAISDRRILDIQDAGVTFRYRDNHQGPREMTLSGVEFLRRFLLHVLPTGFVRIRYYGLFANRRRAENLQRCRALIKVEPGATPLSTPVPSSPSEPKAEAEERDTNQRRPSMAADFALTPRVYRPARTGWRRRPRDEAPISLILGRIPGRRASTSLPRSCAR